MKKKTFVIIGGTSGIGLSVVTRLAKENHHLYVGSRHRQNIQDLNNSTFFYCDVTKNTFDIPKNVDRIDGLMYCPGSLKLIPFRRIKEEDVQKEFTLNVYGLLNAIKYFLPHLKANNNTSSIVLFSSVAVTVGMKYHTLIGATKGAVEGITRSLAAEFAPKIRVNAIAPSITKTPLSKRYLSNEKMKTDLDNRHPLKRIGKTEDISQAAVYLLSEQSSWITGQIIHVDGGISSIRKN